MKKGSREIYENVFDGLSFYQTTGEVYHTNRSKAKVHAFYSEAVRNIKTPKVLDVGCGIGTELFMLPKTGKAQYWGIDISHEAIAHAKQLAKKRGEKNMEFSAHDGNKKLPFANNFFDVVYALELVEHLKDPSVFFEEVRRVLKPGGVCIISTPNESNLMIKVQQLFPKSLMQQIREVREQDFTRRGANFHLNSKIWDEDAHISLKGINDWKKVFTNAGFEIDKIEGSSFYGGSRFVSNSPFLLGLVILLDSFIDKLPIKPHLQMCIVVKMHKPKST